MCACIRFKIVCVYLGSSSANVIHFLVIKHFYVYQMNILLYKIIHVYVYQMNILLYKIIHV